MSIWSTIVSTPFSLKDAKVATWTSTNVYGTANDVASVQGIEITPDITSAQLEGDNRITASATTLRRATVNLTFGGLRLETWAVMTGFSVSTGGTTPNRYESIPIVDTDVCFPYFGLIGKADAAECSGDVHVWAPKAKIESYGPVTFTQNGFVNVAVTMSCEDDGTAEAVEWIQHETATDAVLPPTYITS